MRIEDFVKHAPAAAKMFCIDQNPKFRAYTLTSGLDDRVHGISGLPANDLLILAEGKTPTPEELFQLRTHLPTTYKHSFGKQILLYNIVLRYVDKKNPKH